jgi:hypothetical protein
MKRASIAVNRLLHRIAASIGLEGAFFFAGTALLAAFASFIHPAGPLLVFGVACVLISVSLVVPDKEP